MGVKLFGALAAAFAIAIGTVALLVTGDSSSPPGLTLSYSQDSNLALAAETALPADGRAGHANAGRAPARVPDLLATPAETSTVAPTPAPTTQVTAQAAQQPTDDAASGPIADATQQEEDEDGKDER